MSKHFTVDHHDRDDFEDWHVGRGTYTWALETIAKHVDGDTAKMITDHLAGSYGLFYLTQVGPGEIESVVAVIRTELLPAAEALDVDEDAREYFLRTVRELVEMADRWVAVRAEAAPPA